MIDSVVSSEKQPAGTTSIVMTADGSHTLFDPISGEHYHSLGGALSESRHVFIEAGLIQVMETNDIFHVYETGLGTGLNALLTSLESRDRLKHIHYHACELFPVSAEVTSRLNYPEILTHPHAHSDFALIHALPWDGEPHRIHSHFIISKHQKSFEQMNFQQEQLRLVYFDAFSVGVQPELWSWEVFAKLAVWMLPGAVLVTYSSAGSVKQALRRAGFQVKRLQGASGKRQMLKAVKSE